MKFLSTDLQGVVRIELERKTDDRGSFARIFCEKEFEANGLPSRFVQRSLSLSRQKGTVRALHFQRLPYSESKLVRCVRGAIFDVALDLRPTSSTFGRFQSFELSAENGTSVFLPQGIAHGFQTLVDNTEVLYEMLEFFEPGHATGVRYDDPELGIPWPIQSAILSDWDLSLPSWKAVRASLLSK